MGYNPFHAEIFDGSGRLRCAGTLRTGAGGRCSVFEKDLHPDFLRPCSPSVVLDCLEGLPGKFVEGLEGVFLLGGTSEQLRMYLNFKILFGAYYKNRVYLYAFPRCGFMALNWADARAPRLVQELVQSGARVSGSKRHSVTLDEGSLRKFYINCVLCHEVGHHVARRLGPRPIADTERFADAFARTYAKA